jgi:hypothetical protein
VSERPLVNHWRHRDSPLLQLPITGDRRENFVVVPARYSLPHGGRSAPVQPVLRIRCTPVTIESPHLVCCGVVALIHGEETSTGLALSFFAYFLNESEFRVVGHDMSFSGNGLRRMLCWRCLVWAYRGDGGKGGWLERSSDGGWTAQIKRRGNTPVC